MPAHPIVIVGAGQAGLQVAESLRSEGWEGDIILLGDEPHAPYHRPPLSKAYLLGESTAAQLTMRSPEALARKNISLRTGTSVERIDRERCELHLSGGDRLPYHRLVLAAGARARTLAGADLAGVFSLRGLNDCQQIAAALETAENVVVIGGGFIGLEFAAVARKKGCVGSAPAIVYHDAALDLRSMSSKPASASWHARCRHSFRNGSRNCIAIMACACACRRRLLPLPAKTAVSVRFILPMARIFRPTLWCSASASFPTTNWLKPRVCRSSAASW
jgi:3-phenylpropionate/trans-cinnamate dioxygenase ferredoxin reductase subunit